MLAGRIFEKTRGEKIISRNQKREYYDTIRDYQISKFSVCLGLTG
jgi:hypothetical protein